MAKFICKTCGTQYQEYIAPPDHCLICEDDRQYIGWKGQQWTTLDELRQDHQNSFRQLEPELTGIATEPAFAIGQRALLVSTPDGNLLWDCITLLDPQTVEAVKKLGGIRAIAISHPHYYSSMIEWAHTFQAPVYLHSADRQWVMHPDPSISYWDGDSLPLFGGLSLVRCGGHFPGGTVMHWPAGAAGEGVLLTGDIINVVSDRRWVSFMYSFPNLIPLPEMKVRQIAASVNDLHFDRIYGAWWDREILAGAHESVHRSAERYIRAISGNGLERMQAEISNEYPSIP